MNFDYYLFDLDQTLLYIPQMGDYFDDVLLNTIKELSSKPIPNRKERNKFWTSGEKYLDLLKDWGIIDFDNFWKCFDEIDYEKRKIHIKSKKIVLFNDVMGVLDKLSNANKKLAIVTNTANYIVEFILNTFKISHIFHEVFGLGFEKDIEVAKPSPLGIQKVLKKLNVDSKLSRVIMIGDSFLDIYAAKRAGISACLIRRDINKYPEGYKDWEHQPDYIIDNLEDVFKL